MLFFVFRKLARALSDTKINILLRTNADFYGKSLLASNFFRELLTALFFSAATPRESISFSLFDSDLSYVVL